MKADLICSYCGTCYGESSSDQYRAIIPGQKPQSHGICDKRECWVLAGLNPVLRGELNPV